MPNIIKLPERICLSEVVIHQSAVGSRLLYTCRYTSINKNDLPVYEGTRFRSKKYGSANQFFLVAPPVGRGAFAQPFIKFLVFIKRPCHL
jgi:hypothetical protein